MWQLQAANASSWRGSCRVSISSPGTGTAGACPVSQARWRPATGTVAQSRLRPRQRSTTQSAAPVRGRAVCMAADILPASSTGHGQRRHCASPCGAGAHSTERKGMCMKHTVADPCLWGPMILVSSCCQSCNQEEVKSIAGLPGQAFHCQLLMWYQDPSPIVLSFHAVNMLWTALYQLLDLRSPAIFVSDTSIAKQLRLNVLSLVAVPCAGDACGCAVAPKPAITGTATAGARHGRGGVAESGGSASYTGGLLRCQTAAACSLY